MQAFLKGPITFLSHQVLQVLYADQLINVKQVNNFPRTITAGFLEMPHNFFLSPQVLQVLNVDQLINVKEVHFATHFLQILFSMRKMPRKVSLAPQILQVLYVDQLINVEEVHFAAHWLRTLLPRRAMCWLLAQFPLRLTFPGRFVKLHPRGQLNKEGVASN
jgi:hypothetical protein